MKNIFPNFIHRGIGKHPLVGNKLIIYTQKREKKSDLKRKYNKNAIIFLLLREKYIILFVSKKILYKNYMSFEKRDESEVT